VDDVDCVMIVVMCEWFGLVEELYVIEVDDYDFNVLVSLL